MKTLCLTDKNMNIATVIHIAYFQAIESRHSIQMSA